MHHNTIPHGRRIHVRADFRNSSRNLVTRDEGLSFGGLYLVEEVQVRSADAGGVDLNEDFLGARARIGDLNDLDDAASLEPDRSHDCPHGYREATIWSFAARAWDLLESAG